MTDPAPQPFLHIRKEQIVSTQEDEFLNRIEEGLELGADQGLFESWKGPDGQIYWKLTQLGQVRAREVYERMGVNPDEPDPDGNQVRQVFLRLDAEEQAATS